MERSFDPAKITGPIQLSAAWFVTLLVLEPTLLTAAAEINHPIWAAGLLVLSAIGFAVLVAVAVFLLQTAFRDKQMTDPHRLELLDRKFARFDAAGGQQVLRPVDEEPPNSEPERGTKGSSANDEREMKAREGYKLAYLLTRDDVYELHHGLFLTHYWRPSTTPGQTADIVVQLARHKARKEIVPKTVAKVEYDLGRSWRGSPFTRTSPDDDFRLDVSTYSPALCVAKVYFSDDTEPIMLYRYLDIGLS